MASSKFFFKKGEILAQYFLFHKIKINSWDITGIFQTTEVLLEFTYIQEHMK